MQLKLSDVLDVVSIARRYYIELPAQAQLPGMTKPLDEGERLALSYIQGVFNLAKRKGLLRGDLEACELDLDYEIADSLVVSDEYEVDAGKAGEQKPFVRNVTNHGRP